MSSPLQRFSKMLRSICVIILLVGDAVHSMPFDDVQTPAQVGSSFIDEQLGEGEFLPLASLGTLGIQDPLYDQYNAPTQSASLAERPTVDPYALRGDTRSIAHKSSTKPTSSMHGNNQNMAPEPPTSSVYRNNQNMAPEPPTSSMYRNNPNMAPEPPTSSVYRNNQNMAPEPPTSSVYRNNQNMAPEPPTSSVYRNNQNMAPEPPTSSVYRNNQNMAPEPPTSSVYRKNPNMASKPPTSPMYRNNANMAPEPSQQTTGTTVHAPHRPASNPADPNCKTTPKAILPHFEPSKKNNPPQKELTTYDKVPGQFKTGLSLLVEILSAHKAGRQILEKLNIAQTSAFSSPGQQVNLTPQNADRLLRLLLGLKTSSSGKTLLYQLGLGPFMGLPDPPATLDPSGNGTLRSDLPSDLDFTAYNYNGGRTCVDQLIQYTMDRYNRRRRFDQTYDRYPGYIFTEMDVILTPDQWRYFYGDLPLPPRRGQRGRQMAPLHRFKRKAIKHQRYHWPDKIIPYILDENEFSWSDVMLFERAMYEWEQSTCIRFKMASASDKNKIRFRNGAGCSSHVGMIGGIQNITLQGPCRIRRIVLHEIGHAIGLVHEHQRPDRDEFIRILYENARPGTEWDFKKRTWGTVINHTVGYDYESVMHYGPTAFSMDRRRRTILARDTTYQEVIGRVRKLSFDDKKLVNMMYKCNSHCSKGIVCQYGGYVGKDCTCVCPRGRPNCQRRTRPKPVGNIKPAVDWMRLFQSFAWNALQAMGLFRHQNHQPPPPPLPPRQPMVRMPVFREQEPLDAAIPRAGSLLRQRPRPVDNRQRPQQRLGPLPQQRRPRVFRSRPPGQDVVHRMVHHTNSRYKRDVSEGPTKVRAKRALFRGRRRRVRISRLPRRRTFGHRRRLRPKKRLPRLSRSFFRSISSSEREARMREIRYNRRRRRTNNFSRFRRF